MTRVKAGDTCPKGCGGTVLENERGVFTCTDCEFNRDYVLLAHIFPTGGL